MQGHCAPRSKGVGADLMGVEAEALKSDLGCVKAQERDDIGSGNVACGGGGVGVLSADWGVWVGPVFL